MHHFTIEIIERVHKFKLQIHETTFQQTKNFLMLILGKKICTFLEICLAKNFCHVMYINCCWYNTKENIIYSMEKANKSANIRSVYRICIWNIFRSFDAWPPDHWFNARSIVKNVEVPRPSNNGITALNINVSVDLGYDGSNGFLLIHLFYTWKLNALFCTVMNFQKKNVNFNCNFSPWLIFHCDQRDEKMTKNHLRTIVQSVCNTVSVWYYQISWMHIFTCFELP